MVIQQVGGLCVYAHNSPRGRNLGPCDILDIEGPKVKAGRREIGERGAAVPHWTRKTNQNEKQFCYDKQKSCLCAIKDLTVVDISVVSFRVGQFSCSENGSRWDRHEFLDA